MSTELFIGEKFYELKFKRFNNFLSKNPIGTDIDNSEVWTNARGLLEVNRDQGTNFKIADITNDFEIVDLIRNNRPEIENPLDYATAIWNSKAVQIGAEPFAGAWMLSRYLHDEGIPNFERITSRPSFCKDATLEWYKINMPWVRPGNIHIQQEGKTINSEFKVKEIKRLGVELFFEDSIKHAQEIVNNTSSTYVVIIPQLTNKNYVSVHSRIITIDSDYLTYLPAWLRVYSYLAEKYF